MEFTCASEMVERGTHECILTDYIQIQMISYVWITGTLHASVVHLTTFASSASEYLHLNISNVVSKLERAHVYLNVPLFFFDLPMSMLNRNTGLT